MAYTAPQLMTMSQKQLERPFRVPRQFRMMSQERRARAQRDAPNAIIAATGRYLRSELPIAQVSRLQQ